MLYNKYLVNLTPENTNYRLSKLYESRDNISHHISTCIASNLNADNLYLEYSNICDVIDKICQFRVNNDCPIKGDPDYKED